MMLSHLGVATSWCACQCPYVFVWRPTKKELFRKKERKKEGLTSVSPSRDDVGDAPSTQKEANYASHAESPNCDPEESHTRCRVKIQNPKGRGERGETEDREEREREERGEWERRER